MTDATAAVMAARRRVQAARRGADPTPLAEALEALATEATEAGVLTLAASALEEAASCWERAHAPDRGGTALLLAAGSRRLVADLATAAHDLSRARAMRPLPDAVARALEMEEAEQRLAGGEPDVAVARFSTVLDALAAAGETGVTRARVQQRRAAAAIAAEAWPLAVDDLLSAEAAFRAEELDSDADDAALGAAFAGAHVDVAAAERILGALRARPGGDDPVWQQKLTATAARVAAIAGDGAAAVVHFDLARKAALAADDPLGYLDAAVQGAEWAAHVGDEVGAYGRLAAAWVTIDDALGEGCGRELVRPALERLRSQLGIERFAGARAGYEASRRRD